MSRFQDWWEDPKKRAWILRLFWLISLGMILFGYAVIVLRLFG
ncbi:MAG: hypothetical protein ACE5I4_02455 [Thermoplasmata archaeon]